MYIHPRLKSSFDFVYLFHYHQKLSGFFVWFIRFGFMAREELWKIISRAQFSRHVEVNTLLGAVYTLMCSLERCIRSGGGSVEGGWKLFFLCVLQSYPPFKLFCANDLSYSINSIHALSEVIGRSAWEFQDPFLYFTKWMIYWLILRFIDWLFRRKRRRLPFEERKNMREKKKLKKLEN